MNKFVKHTVLTILIFSAIGCSESNIELERNLEIKIKEDGAALAQLEAVYGVVFTNQKENWVSSDDIYIRKDMANVYYGYGLEEAKISVVDEDDIKVLKVILPAPKQISVDRKTVSVESTHEDYNPRGPNGEMLNVDLEMNKKLEEISAKYSAKTIEMTKNITKKYFETLAFRFDLKLDITFEK
ncbi:MAG: DUF4230 domain-containing protein [Melioribacteraceae bacterium]|nr:DUF4230 domain-containing protein [Melioribacteraceae bacterium]MCF8265270.1 DUF4230 domain-containing protein [Melioribacteraceae bacterium]MCF8431732.1 DUF4230 domain-containing protein [Melioribacteraceae bacterium]